ncbi:hypothetical protein B0O99DRAFT_630629 [Bisporella sp. PMI_857]|nr:hypothetical protein B0O99DRAFT_630629 [Bisporella sp. PMI_857]
MQFLALTTLLLASGVLAAPAQDKKLVRRCSPGTYECNLAGGISQCTPAGTWIVLNNCGLQGLTCKFIDGSPYCICKLNPPKYSEKRWRGGVNYDIETNKASDWSE